MEKKKSNQRFNLTYLLLAIICLVSSFSNIYSQKIADFSGEWVLNRTKGKTRMAEVLTQSLSITQKDLALTINSTVTPDNGQPVKNTVNYLLNTSAESANDSSVNKTRRVDSKLEPDCQSFSITETISYIKDGKTIKVQQTEKYSISKDSKTIMIETFQIDPEKPSIPKDQPIEIRIYDKKI